jgi:hypothetical protein
LLWAREMLSLPGMRALFSLAGAKDLRSRLEARELFLLSGPTHSEKWIGWQMPARPKGLRPECRFWRDRLRAGNIEAFGIAILKTFNRNRWSCQSGMP